jgi:hypothetical protein
VFKNTLTKCVSLGIFSWQLVSSGANEDAWRENSDNTQNPYYHNYVSERRRTRGISSQAVEQRESGHIVPDRPGRQKAGDTPTSSTAT